jgi:transcriptional regulator with XRE-family HTH domain
MKENQYHLPPRIKLSLTKLGEDIEIARKKRRLTTTALCERAGISRPLYLRMIHGAPGTSIGAYAMVFFGLGLGTIFDEVCDSVRDTTGMLLEEGRLPKRIRPSKTKTGAL